MSTKQKMMGNECRIAAMIFGLPSVPIDSAAMIPVFRGVN
jgi:hypothetical protein